MEYRKLNNFPKGFMWGASSSAFQSEGAQFEDGKGKSAMDMIKYPDNLSDLSVAVDHYHRYKEDIALMAEMGFKAYRFALSWTRILPQGTGKVNQLAIDHYNDVINECLKYGIEPVVTLFHFDTPQALIEKYNGWYSREIINDFANYCTICFKEFGDRVKHWTVNNEYNAFVMETLGGSYLNMMYGKKCFDSEDKKIKDAALTAHIQLVAESKVIGICRKMWSDAYIGPTVNVPPAYPCDSKPENYIASMDSNTLYIYYYLDVACLGRYNSQVIRFLEDRNAMFEYTEEDKKFISENNANWISLNYYFSHTVQAAGIDEPTLNAKEVMSMGGKDDRNSYVLRGAFKGVDNPNLKQTIYGWEVDPIGMRVVLRILSDRYNLPIIITENGLGVNEELTSDEKVHDNYRIEFYKEHLHQCKLAINDGVNLVGYCPWSAFDLLSTHQGMKKRYGFIYVDRTDKDLKTLRRIKKDSFYWYKNVIAENGESI